MAELAVQYSPRPIPWKFHRDAHGKQIDAGKANVILMVRAIDKDTLEPVHGLVTSVIDPPPFGDDPNDLRFNTNEPQHVTLFQITSHERPPGQSPFIAPEVEVTADGYEGVSLILR